MLALKIQLTIDDIIDTVHVFPTLYESKAPNSSVKVSNFLLLGLPCRAVEGEFGHENLRGPPWIAPLCGSHLDSSGGQTENIVTYAQV